MAWLSNWGYRKKITISGSSGAGTNYQVLLKIGESSGASGYDFHLEGHSASFPSNTNQGGDLRFTSSDGSTLLDFWVESVTGSSPNRVAYVWVEVADDLGSNRDIYCYYGNASATNYSNASNTFNFWEGFESGTAGSTIDGTNGWVVTKNNVAFSTTQSKEGNKSAEFYNSASDTNPDCYNTTSPLNNLTNYAIHYSIRKSTTSTYGGDIYIYLGTSDKVVHMAMYNDGYFKVYDGSYRNLDTPTTYSANTWYDIEIRINSTPTADIYINRALKETDLIWNKTSNSRVRFIGWGGGPYIYLDKIFVRKYISPEPSFSSASSEQLANTGNFFLFF